MSQAAKGLVARQTLERAERFLARARALQSSLNDGGSRADCEDFLTATIAFAGSVWDYMSKQLARVPGFRPWLETARSSDNLFTLFRLARNIVIHHEPGRFPRHVSVTLTASVIVTATVDTQVAYGGLQSRRRAKRLRDWLNSVIAKPVTSSSSQPLSSAAPQGSSITDDYLSFELDTKGSPKLKDFAKKHPDWVASTLGRPIWDVLGELLAALERKTAEAESRFL